MKTFRFIAVVAIILLLIMLWQIVGTSPSVQAIEPGDSLLVWTAPYLEPGDQNAENTGELAFLSGDGTVSPIFSIIPQVTRVKSCTLTPTAPDGRYAIYMGTEGGVVASLYMLDSTNDMQLVDDSFHLLACHGGNGLLDWSPSGDRFAYIDYERAFDIDFADGTLRVLDGTDYSEIFAERNVVTFAQNDEGVLNVQFFTDSFNEADEAVLNWWDGSAKREITAIMAEENCRFLNANAVLQDDIWLGLVHRFDSGGANVLTLYQINPEDGTSTAITSMETRGRYMPGVELNQLIPSPDGQAVFFTMPDGVTNSTASFHVYYNGATSTLIDRQMVVNEFSALSDPVAKVSPDGETLVTVVTTPNNQNNSLQQISLTDPAAPPKVLATLAKDDVFLFFDFTADSQSVIYVAGGTAGRDNSVFSVDLSAAAPESQRIVRGYYAKRWAALAPDGSHLVIREYQLQEEGILGPDWLNTVAIDLESGAITTLFEGGHVENNEVIDLKFAAPIRWQES